MKTYISASIFMVIAMTSASCGSLKRVDGQAPPPPAKSGVTWGGPIMSGGGVQKGYWCDVKGGVLTFGSSGPTEAKATEIAMQKCADVHKSSPCKPVSCKPN